MLTHPGTHIGAGHLEIRFFTVVSHCGLQKEAEAHKRRGYGQWCQGLWAALPRRAHFDPPHLTTIGLLDPHSRLPLCRNCTLRDCCMRRRNGGSYHMLEESEIQLSGQETGTPVSLALFGIGERCCHDETNGPVLISQPWDGALTRRPCSVAAWLPRASGAPASDSPWLSLGCMGLRALLLLPSAACC